MEPEILACDVCIKENQAKLDRGEPGPFPVPVLKAAPPEEQMCDHLRYFAAGVAAGLRGSAK